MSKTKQITISGGFHNAGGITIRAKIDPRGGITISPAQANRVGKHMCGLTGCMCGMHHGWEIEGSDRAELSEAFQIAQVTEYLNSSKNH